MDTKLYVSILRVQSEHVSNLAAKLAAEFKRLEQVLSQQDSSLNGDTAGLGNGLAGLQSRLAVEADMLCKRLQLFLEGDQRGHASTKKQEIK